MTPSCFTLAYLMACALERTESITFHQSPCRKLPQKTDWLQIHHPRSKPNTVPRKFWTHWADQDSYPALTPIPHTQDGIHVDHTAWKRNRLLPKKFEDAATKRTGASCWEKQHVSTSCTKLEIPPQQSVPLRTAANSWWFSQILMTMQPEQGPEIMGRSPRNVSFRCSIPG